MVRFSLVVGMAAVICGLGGSAGLAAPPPSSLSQPFDISFGFLPLSPTKALPPSSRFAAAPVPNLERGLPVLRNLGPAQAELSPGLFNTKRTYRGEGFTVGSTAQDEQQKHFMPTPGVNLSVPLQ